MKTRYTALQIALEAIGALLIVLMAVFVIVHWNTLPEAIPVHYDSHGDVDRWASRWEIFVMPLIGLAIYLLLTVWAVFPRLWGLPDSLPQAQRRAIHIRVRTMLGVLKLEILGAIFYITLRTVERMPVPGWFLLAFLLLLGGTLAGFLFSISRLNKQ